MLVASDADGTLLDDQDHVGERTRAAIARVAASGTPFVLASGRPPRWMPWVAEAAGVSGYAVCCNGAVHYDLAKDLVLASQTIGPEQLATGMERLRAGLPDVSFAAERVGNSANDPNITPFLTEPGYSHPWDGERPRFDAATKQLAAEPAVKLLARVPGLPSDEMAQIVHELDDLDLVATFSATYGLVEFGPAGVTKASGLATITAELGIPNERVLAFGDMPNDVAMLRWAGHGVAMGNAHQDVLAVADEVTASNNEDGIAEVLDRWF